MRLLLDAHVSDAHVGEPLRRRGHDVRALSREGSLEGLDDEQVLGLAAAERRILVTHDVGTVPAVLRRWAEAERSHAGVILVHGIRQNEFDVVIRAVERLLGERPRAADWVDIVAVAGRTESK